MSEQHRVVARMPPDAQYGSASASSELMQVTALPPWKYHLRIVFTRGRLNNEEHPALSTPPSLYKFLGTQSTRSA
jgi:hypothetical protein